METFPLIIALIVIVFIVIALWKVFEKAGEPGWAAIIPIYNYYVMTKIAGKPGWWTVLMLIPYVSIVFNIWVWNLIVQKFGKGTGFTVGVVLLPIIFIPILGFGDAQFTGDSQVDVDSFGSKTPDVNLEA